MNVDNLRQNAGRWVRVSILTLTTLGPIINVVASRLRERAKTLQQDATTRGQATLAQSQGQLVAVGASLSDTLSDLKDNPYSQQLLKRGSELAGTLTDQGGKLSQAVAERSNNIARDVAERGSKVTQIVAERGSKATQEFAKQSQRTTREVARRTRRAAEQAQRELRRASSQVRVQAIGPDYAARFWSILGFIVGLISAVTAAYLLVRQRFQSNTRQDAVVQLSNRAQLNGASGTANRATSTPPAQTSTPVTTATPTPSSTTDVIPTQASLSTNARQLTANPQSEDAVSTPDTLAVEVPAEVIVPPSQDAEVTPDTDETVLPAESLETPTASGLVGDDESPTIKQEIVSNSLASKVETDSHTPVAQASPVAGPAILGVVSTKRFYPVETPLSDLRPANGDELDVIYFANEGEAEAQGYSAAE